MKKILIIFIIIIISSFSAISVQAALLNGLPGPQVMPDSPLYFLKIWYEKVILFFAFNDAKKAEQYSKLAERRLYEAEKMARKGNEKLTKKALEAYEEYLNKAITKAEEAKKEAQEGTKKAAEERANQALEKISESTLKSQEVLLRVYQLVPDEVKDVIEGIISITKNGYEKAVEAVSGIKKERLEEEAEDIKNRAKDLLKGWRKIFGE